jgi:hypothetical protein
MSPTPLLTDDERLVMTTTMALHGFGLYRKPRAREQFMLIGRPLGRHHNGGQMMYEAVAKWKSGEIAPTVSESGFSSRWLPMDWAKLTDEDLSGFHRTVMNHVA